MVSGTTAATARLLRRRLADRDLWLPVDGWSMHPTIRPPARVLVSGRPSPRLGEVWAFVGPDGAVVVHRVVRRTREGFVFHGDGVPVADPVVSSEMLVGRVVAADDERGARIFGRADRIAGLAGRWRRDVMGRWRRHAQWVFWRISRRPWRE